MGGRRKDGRKKEGRKEGRKEGKIERRKERWNEGRQEGRPGEAGKREGIKMSVKGVKSRDLNRE